MKIVLEKKDIKKIKKQWTKEAKIKISELTEEQFNEIASGATVYMTFNLKINKSW